MGRYVNVFLDTGAGFLYAWNLAMQDDDILQASDRSVNLCTARGRIATAIQATQIMPRQVLKSRVRSTNTLTTKQESLCSDWLTHLRHNALLHPPRRCLSLGRDGIHLIHKDNARRILDRRSK